jgi:hypothetical protein
MAALISFNSQLLYESFSDRLFDLRAEISQIPAGVPGGSISPE